MNEAGHVLQQKLAQAEQALERCEKIALANRFAGAIMHEVNNPLEAITNLVYLTKLQSEEPDKVLENMQVVEQQLQILGRVTGQALKFHRQEGETKDWDLAEIAESALKLHADKISRHGVIVERHMSSPAIASMFGTEILQVVSNLILNALDAIPKGKGRLHVCVKARGKSVHLTIVDNGAGIPEHVKTKLFEPYMTSKAHGTGLGLWLSKRIVTKHNGSLRFRTCQTTGRSGTTFRITLPVAAVA